MAKKIVYRVMTDSPDMQNLVRAGIVAAVRCGSSDLIVARYSVNKKTLIKISKEEMGRGASKA